MSRDEQTRREFCTHACRAFSLAAAGLATGAILPGCGSSPSGPSGASALPVVTAAETGGTLVLTIDSSSPLSTVGGAALIQSSVGPVLVAQTAQNVFNAVTGICTHAACTITGYANQQYVCPCHGSQFTTSGQVVSGPAPAPLSRYVTAFSNNVLTITV